MQKPIEFPFPKILDFDIENRPSSYYGGDLTTAEITAIAWSWSHEPKVHCALLGPHNPETILLLFRRVYEQADIVTGHYIRKHDLPLINGAMVEAGLPPLGLKRVIDTKLDLKTWSFEAQPKSQEELALTLGIEAPKVHMTQHDWREANRLTPKGIELTKQRVTADVKQHKQLRHELTRRNLLKYPAGRDWKP